MTEKEDLGLKPAPRLEQIGDRRRQQVHDRKHRKPSCADSVSPRESGRMEFSGRTPDWIHEIKHDGYRLMARLEGRRTRLFPRRGRDWTERFPRIRAALAVLRAGSASMDGEAVVCCPPRTGVSLFDRLHSGRHDGEVVLYAFNLLELKRPRSTHPAA